MNFIYNNIGSEIIWIGVDDTDSKAGGCTTYIAQAIVKKLHEKNYNIIGYPRLVRLNPNIPWKTRGNGAISIRIGKGNGKKIKIGMVGHKDIFSYQRLTIVYKKNDINKIKNIVEGILKKYAKINDKNTNPGYVITQKQPSYKYYEKAVKEIVLLSDTKQLLQSLGANFGGFNNHRGIIGATAAISWSPKTDYTYELLTYRREEKWGTKRIVDNESVKNMDKICTSTFDNFDYENNHNRLVPNSPCPVLYGIRGDNDKELLWARSKIRSEAIDRWMIFITNQGTDDHLIPKTINEIRPYQSAIVEGTVYSNPTTIRGGHVIFTLRDKTGVIDCAAYEPTKQFRQTIRKIYLGDIIKVFGGVRKQPLTINLEKINIKQLKKIIVKTENPICTICGKHMKSMGKNQGYKCKNCKVTKGKPCTKVRKRVLHKGFYEVPICARRHLSKPLKRMR